MNSQASYALLVVLLSSLVLPACAPDTGRSGAGASAPATLHARLDSVARASGAEVVGVYYRSLAEDGDSVTLNADVRMHAASTMKVPVMMRLFLDDQEGIRALDSTMPVKRTFYSIVDSSTYDLPPESDSDTTFYGRVGEDATIRSMVDRMITWSSNLATNILIEVAEPARIETMLSRVGADSMSVLR
ncbi:MAG: serine hydrolase, partial [Longimicrobiales bacterium]|nr:serine hydrolase [Longimicrobiales bacterium]